MSRILLFSGVALAVAVVAAGWALTSSFCADSRGRAPDPGVTSSHSSERRPMPRVEGRLAAPRLEGEARSSTRSLDQGAPNDPSPRVGDADEGDALEGVEIVDATETELRDLKVPAGMTGVVIKSVHPASSAREAALQKHDVIVRADRDKITSLDSLKAAVGARPRTLLTVYRDGYPFQVVLHRPFKGGDRR